MKKTVACIIAASLALCRSAYAYTYIADGPANVRTGAGLEHTVIGQMAEGSAVDVLEWDVGNGWALVNTGYETGYIFNQLIGCTDKTAEMQSIANQYYSVTDKVIVVDSSGYPCVYVFAGPDHNRVPCASFTCSVGKAETPTPTGVFTVQNKRGMIDSVTSWEYYMTDFAYDWDGVAWGFHSTLFYPGTYEPFDSRLGEKISNGCVRLSLDHAQWIYENCGVGTTVVIV